MMIPILLCGEKDTAKTGSVLCEILENYGKALYFSQKKLFGADAARFLILDCKAVPEITALKGILLFKSDFVSPKEKPSLSGLIPVTVTENTQALSFLSGTGIPAVTCGLSSRDTLSISSIKEGSASVSLQRSICTLKKTVVEPCEIEISMKKPRTAEQILTACAVLLLSDLTPDYQF